MSKTIAIFGAGTGLGSSVARRFGRKDFRVALVGRRPDPLNALVAELAADGIEAAAFPADLTDTSGVPSLIAAIVARLGAIDVVEYAPSSPAPMTPAMHLDPDTLQRFVSLYLLTPVAIINEVLPAMLDRGDGGILIGHGALAVNPLPRLSGRGPAMAAMRNYLYSLHGEVAERGVYVGTVAVKGMVIGSAGHQALTSGALSFAMPTDAELPIIHPDELADLYWTMYTTRDRVEQVYPVIDHRAA
jgi:short-subunit dehydrogenase